METPNAAEKLKELAQSRAKSLLADGKWRHNHYDDKGMEIAVASIILSAITQATKFRHSGQAVGAQPGDDDYLPPEAHQTSGQAVDRQWTPEHLPNAFELPQWLQSVCAAHNTLLAAQHDYLSTTFERVLIDERQRRERAERQAIKDAEEKAELRDYAKTQNDRLLSALAAIKETRQQLSTMNDFVPSRLVAVTLRTIDLSLLHQHDAEVRQSLVEAIEMCAVNNAPKLWKEILLAALAKVKEKP